MLREEERISFVLAKKNGKSSGRSEWVNILVWRNCVLEAFKTTRFSIPKSEVTYKSEVRSAKGSSQDLSSSHYDGRKQKSTQYEWIRERVHLRSMIKSRKKVGGWIESWETPLLIALREEKWVSTHNSYRTTKVKLERWLETEWR